MSQAGYGGWKGVPRPTGLESRSMKQASVVSKFVDVGLMANLRGLLVSVRIDMADDELRC